MNDKIATFGNIKKEIQDLNDKILESDIVIYRGYMGFPNYYYSGKKLNIDAIYVTNRGVLAILYNFDSKENADFVYNKLKGVLMNNTCLMSRRELMIDIDVYELNNVTNQDEFRFKDINELLNFYLKKDKLNLSENLIRQVINTLETGLKKENKNRIPTSVNENLTEIEKNISVYDNSQLKCLQNYDSRIQVISGLAGSGKTVVLCKKIAELLLSDDRIKVCITFQSRSLKEEIRKMVFDFLKTSTDIPDVLMERLDIINAWGDQNGDGFYSNLCKKLNVTPMSLYIAKKYNYNDPFLFVCKELYDYLEGKENDYKIYDYILIDEAQDLNEYFLKLAFTCLKQEGKLIYAYDEFQNLDSKLMKQPDQIFGKNINYKSTPLQICYRTPKEILVTAHSIGMGINSEEGICHFFEKESIWESIGYNLKKNNNHAICTRENSPVFEKIKDHDCISLKDYKNINELAEDLVELILKDIKDGFLYDDIMIVDLEKWKTIDDFNVFKNKAEGKFNTSFAGFNDPNKFFEKGKIMYSYVYRAKGNEAYKVYIVNAQLSMNNLLRDVWRNRLFTAMTRSKYEVVLLCVKDNLFTSGDFEKLKKEIEIVKNNEYELKFEYPSLEEIKNIKLISETNIRTENNIEKTAIDLENLKKNINAIEHISDILKGKFDIEELQKLASKLVDNNEK